MSEVVPIETDAESQTSEVTPTEGATSETATPSIDEATWKRRIAGKDQALTAAQRERDAIKAERDELSRWKAEQEQANMTELQKVQAERDRLAAEAAAAKAEAAAAKLARQFPLAAEFLGDDLSKFDEVRVAEFEGRLVAQKQESESENEPRIDSNSPRRTPPAKAPANDLDAAKAALVAAGNPFFADV
jgi:hypothetical protein